MLSGKDIVYFGLDRWGGPLWKDRHEICWRLAEKNRVVYVDSRSQFRSLRHGLRTGRITWQELRGSSLRQMRPGLWVFHYPDWAPISARYPTKQFFRAIRRASLRSVLRRLNMTQPIVWLNTPGMVDLVSEVPSPALRIYHATDQYCAYQNVAASLRTRIIRQERSLLECVDIVIATEKGLFDDKRKINTETYLVPNGVRFSDYQGAKTSTTAPAGIANIERPRLGYIGLVGDRLDFGMLKSAAELRPDCSLILIGELRIEKKEKEWRELIALPNVHLIGPVTIDQVPHYVNQFDVGLIPYQQDEEALYACPLKLFEYLAAGIPVASIDIPAVRLVGDYVSIARNADEFPTAIDHALADKSPEKKEERTRIGYRNRWSLRLERISAIIDYELQRRRRSPPLPQPPYIEANWT
jgi:glycosyltransferase involved in cell wall biosynthesis